MIFLDVQHISDDHPAVEFLHDLEAYCDEKSSHALRQLIIWNICMWAISLKYELKVGAP